MSVVISHRHREVWLRGFCAGRIPQPSLLFFPLTNIIFQLFTATNEKKYFSSLLRLLPK